jgi:hypothetical protein
VNKKAKSRYCIFMDRAMKEEVDKLCDIVKRDKRLIIAHNSDYEVNFSFIVRLFVKEGLDSYFAKYRSR